MTEVGDRTRLLPPGVSDGDFDRAVDDFTAALGPERVLTSDTDLAEFRDPFSFATWDDYVASAVVMSRVPTQQPIESSATWPSEIIPTRP